MQPDQRSPRSWTNVGFLFVLLVLPTVVLALPTDNRPPTPVKIVEPLPLPVTGSVDINGTPTVILAPDATVKVENPDGRPLLVQNVDEPGRQPHSVWVEFTMTDTPLCSWNCENIARFGWVAVMDVSVPVPEGKRWVITHISGRLPTAGPTAHVALQDMRIISLQMVKAGYFGPFFPVQSDGSTIMQQFGGPIFTTVGPGEKAHLNVLAEEPNNYFSFVNLSGYLIDAPPGAAATAAQSSAGTEPPPLAAPGSPAGARVEQKLK